MLDIKLIKDNPELFKKRLSRRNKDYSNEIDRLVELDAKRRALIADTEAKKAEQNIVSKKIPLMKKNGEDVAPIFEEMKALSNIIKADNETIDKTDAEIINDIKSGQLVNIEFRQRFYQNKNKNSENGKVR